MIQIFKLSCCKKIVSNFINSTTVLITTEYYYLRLHSIFFKTSLVIKNLV